VLRNVLFTSGPERAEKMKGGATRALRRERERSTE
jgi:hypothetical protein